MTKNIYINKALALYHQYCPVNSNYPDQIHTITKALQLDNSSLVAIILYINRQHDFNLEKHKHHFNDNIIYLVDIINKLSTTHDKPDAEQYIHFNKLLLTINSTLQETAILTSLVPLLHKVSIFNLEYNNTDAHHISEIITNCYIPYLLSYTAHNDLAYLLQDLCFKIQYPEERNRILHYMNWLYPDIDNIIHNIDNQFRNIFRKLNIKANLSYRIKSPYAIWIKTLVKDIDITALNDILGFRAIVPNKKACYDFSKLIHLHYNTITSQFVDYIRYPKNNGYQSIHLIISGGSNKGNIELQIRSTTMHRQTQYGSAHHTYKANKYYVSRTNNNLSLLIKDTNTIPYNFSLNINLNLRNILEYKLVPLAVVQIPASNLLFEHNSVFINITYKPILAECAFPATIMYAKIHKDLNVRSIFESSLPKTDITTAICNTSSGILNNQDISEQYSQKNLWLDTRNIFFSQKDRIIDLLIYPENIKKKIDNISQCDKDTLLKYAPQFGYSGLVPLLIEHGANTSTSDNNGKSILHAVAEYGALDLVKLLIPQDINMNANTDSGETVLHCVIKSSNLDLVRDLVEVYHAKINIQNNRGDTPLHYAVIYRTNLKLIEFLIKHGADVNATNNDGEIVLHHAVRNNDLVLVQLLMQYSIDLKMPHSKMALHAVAAAGDLDLVFRLIESGANIYAITDHGETVLQSSVNLGHFHLTKALMLHDRDLVGYCNNTSHNDLFRYIEYTNTTPQQSMLENDETYDLQQYKQNTSVNLKTDEISNPAPESLDIQNHSSNLRSNTCIDITPLSLDQIECHITAIPKSIDDTERPLHTLEQKVQFYTGNPCYYSDYKGYYQRGSMEYNSYRYQDATLYYDFAINIINNTNYEEYRDKKKHCIIELLGNIYVDKGNALCMQHKYDEGIIQYNDALLTYNKLIKQDHIEYLIVLAQHNFGSAMLEQAIDKYQQGDETMAQEYYKKTLELYKPGEKHGLCNINELGTEILNSLDHHTIKNKYISIYGYSNTDILHTNILGEVEPCH